MSGDDDRPDEGGDAALPETADMRVPGEQAGPGSPLPRGADARAPGVRPSWYDAAPPARAGSAPRREVADLALTPDQVTAETGELSPLVDGEPPAEAPAHPAPGEQTHALARPGVGQLAAAIDVPRRDERQRARPATERPPRVGGMAASLARAPAARPARSGGGGGGAPRASALVSPSVARQYPRMLALLRDPERVLHRGGRDAVGPGPARVGQLAREGEARLSRTFFPTRRQERDPPQGRAEPADLDEMLVAMADGLLVGEDESGHAEVRVTLRDEFFAGTELRITAGGGRVRAVLVPPDRSTYLELNGNIDELRERLEARGLKVEELRVREP